MGMIDGIILKRRHIDIVIPEALQRQALQQLHVNHVGIGKTKLLACKSIYWIGVNLDIKNHINISSTCLDFQQTQPKEKKITMRFQANPGK